jgi:enamine deaminase RidA (YjgF/YER057c/UK114 family)
MRKPLVSILLAAASLAVLAAAPANAQIKHVGAPTAAIAKAVVVPAGADMAYVSGITPPVLNAGAPAGTPPEFGDTKTQTLGIMKQIDEILKGEGFSMGDVVMMRVLLVGDPAKGGKMDFAGMMEGYKQYFGTEAQPNKPARITSQIVSLVQPGMMVEIEVQAAKAKK